MRSTFHGFSTALSGLMSSQKWLDVTGQNITNMGTPGYTRQRLDLYSIGSPLQNSQFTSRYSNSAGQGVSVDGVSQIRDPFLDVRFRREAAQTGEIDANLSILEDLESLFDETQNKALGAQLEDLKTQLQTLSSHTGFKEFDSIVRSSAESLTKLLNQYSGQLSSIREQEEYNFEKVSVANVNDILKNISELNSSIKRSELSGNPALELMDQRNQLIDELSTYMNINVTYTPTDVGAGRTVNILTIDFMGSGGKVPLIKNDKYAALTAEKVGGKMTLSTVFDGKAATKTELTDQLTTGIFKGALDGLNKSGVFDNPSSDCNGIGYYEKRLDLLASKFASIMNDANQALNPAYDPTGPADATNPQYLDRPLFGTTDGSTAITAKNICIASGWKNNDYMITATKNPPSTNGDQSADNSNITNILALFEKDINFGIDKPVLNPDGTPVNPPSTVTQNIFTGTFAEYYGDCNNVLALDVKSQTSSLGNHQSLLNGVADLRDSVSAVSLDEEGIHLLQYQKSYSAAARFMTTLDQALDTLINRTGTVGL